MPWMIAKKGEEYCVYKKGADGKPMGKTKGCHSSRKKAEGQMAALHANVLESVELAHGELRDRVRAALEIRYAIDPSTMEGLWVKEMYADRVIYEHSGKMWQLSFEVDERGDVHLAADEAVVLLKFVPITEEHVGVQSIAAVAQPFRILESEQDSDSLLFEGCVLIDEVLSQGGGPKGRYYSAEFNTR